LADWNPASIEAIIDETADRIEKGVVQVDAAYREYLQKDLDFDIAEAKAYVALGEEGVPAHERKYRTLLEVTDERLARDLADADHRLMDRNMKALERKLDAYRSIGTSVRQAYAQGMT
jgi:DNA-binding transcriptional MerR regulator